MRTLSRQSAILLLLASCSLAGCTSTSGIRTSTAPKARTVVSIGDKPLPVVTGEPGSSVAADDYTPERKPANEGRVSGRVFDEKGQPVPNVQVRLALGGSSGGKIVRTTTDKSGAFTLRGLRPGSNYTLIAELKDEDQGLLTGRTEVEAPDGDVQISLAPDGADAAQATSRPVSPVSRPRNGQNSGDDDEDVEDVGKIPVKPKRDDTAPPAEAAESLLPTRARGAVKTTPSSARWHAGDAPRTASSATDGSAATSRSAAREESDTANADDGDYDDGGVNPLPPALEPDAVAPSGKGGDPSAFEDAPADESADRIFRNARKPKAAALDTMPGARVIVPENYSPIALADKPAPLGRFVRTAPPPSQATKPSAVEAPPAVPWYEAQPKEKAPAVAAAAPSESTFVVPAPEAPPKEERRRPTWRELTANLPAGPVQLDQMVAETRGEPTTAEGRLRPIVAEGTTRPTRADNRPPQGPAAFCRFDSKSRRIVDFQLPDVAGNPVRLQDLDADLILVDFWGSWCKPCLDSIPHLVDLQNRLGTKRLKVVGIACEQGPPAQRAATVSKTMKRLGINYAVLMSGMDGETCPVQEALHIQAFPTLILLDRQGHILWRDQGATNATLSRLDHFIAAATNPDTTRR